MRGRDWSVVATEREGFLRVSGKAIYNYYYDAGRGA